MAGWYFQFDPLIVANATFDVACLSTCLYLLVMRGGIKNHLALKGTTSQISQQSGNPATIKAPVRQRSSSTQGLTAPPQTNIPTYSIWSRKRWDLVAAATVATFLWHSLRLIIVVLLSMHSVRHAKLKHEAEMKAANSTDGEVPSPIEIEESNPFTEQPALFIVTTLPAIAVISRIFIIAAFAWVQKSFFPLSVNTNSQSSTPMLHSPSSPSPRTPKQEVILKSKHEQDAHRNPTSPTSAHNKSAPPVPTTPPSSIWTFVSDLPARVHGPRQNLYLLAFYICIGMLVTLVPFTYHVIWYFDTPRIELVTTLYLAAVLQDSKNVPGLTNKEKVMV
jgi:hypothetical protein